MFTLSRCNHWKDSIARVLPVVPVRVSHEFQTRVHSHRLIAATWDRMSLRPAKRSGSVVGLQTSERVSQWFSLHMPLLFIYLNRTRVDFKAKLNCPILTDATDPRVYLLGTRKIRVGNPATFRERKSSFGTIQSTSLSRTIRSSERNGSW